MVISALVVGAYGASQNIGEISNVVQQAVNEPLGFLPSFTFYTVALDVWVPTLSPEFLADRGIGFLSWFYPFSGGHVPHFSIWTFSFSLLLTGLIVFLYLYFSEADFFFHGLGLSIPTFFGLWYSFTLLAWWAMFYFGQRIGLSSDTVYQVWLGSVTATGSTWLTYFFIVTALLGGIWTGRKIGGIII